MYACPNCASNLKFDISRQALFCEACETVLNPYDVVKEQDAQESNVFEVNVFTCPQCGGEIITEDNEAAAFCSYCGGSTILNSRLDSLQRPQYIVPFQKTKADCVESYKKRMKGAIFAPKSVKDAGNIDSFRGIYMPFWDYSCSRDGYLLVHGKKVYTRGNYEYTDHYDISSNLNSYYSGVSYDASSTFSDDLSGAIAPYDQTKKIPFTPSFLSGFYADSTDVPAEAYDTEVKNVVNNDCASKIVSRPPYSQYGVKSSEAANSIGHTIKDASLVMLPVWFMSHRVKDHGQEKITYTVINGQTGKAAGDIPIDFKKYAIVSAIASLGLFLLLNFVFNFTFRPKTVLAVSAVFAVIVSAIRGSQIKNIAVHENGYDDIGLLVKRNIEYETEHGSEINSAVKTAVDRVRSISPSKVKYKSNAWKFGLASVILTVLMFVINSYRDSVWYVAVMLVLGGSVLQIVNMMKNYNKLTTRKLPQFNRTGGDDSAKRINK